MLNPTCAEEDMSRPIELYYWPIPNGWKVSIALEEMGLPYKVNLIDIGAGDQFAPEYLKIAPNNRMPAIIDPDGRMVSRSRSSKAARSCNIWPARPARSAATPSVSVSRSING